MRYVFQWSYRSGIGGPWAKGEVIDFDPAVAAWINHDSPGVLIAERVAAPQAAPEPAIVAPDGRDVQDAPNRMMAEAPRRRGRPAGSKGGA